MKTSTVFSLAFLINSIICALIENPPAQNQAGPQLTEDEITAIRNERAEILNERAKIHNERAEIRNERTTISKERIILGCLLGAFMGLAPPLLTMGLGLLILAIIFIGYTSLAVSAPFFMSIFILTINPPVVVPLVLIAIICHLIKYIWNKFDRPTPDDEFQSEDNLN